VNYLEAAALLSREEPTPVYRYRLWRIWDEKKPRCLFVMLNPSTADGKQDDPTIRKCVGFADRWGFGRIDVVNLYAFRATDPRELKRHLNWHAIGQDCDLHIGYAAGDADRIVCAWGNSNPSPQRAWTVVDTLRAHGKPLHCLGLTGQGNPSHPLMLAYSTPLVPYDFRSSAGRRP
jgi:hypothetical protein